MRDSPIFNALQQTNSDDPGQNRAQGFRVSGFQIYRHGSKSRWRHPICLQILYLSGSLRRGQYDILRIRSMRSFFISANLLSGVGRIGGVKRVFLCAQINRTVSTDNGHRKDDVEDVKDQDLLQDRKRVPKSKEFYHTEGNERRYYYTIDTRGHLFLESSKIKLFATAFRDAKFLSFFYRRLEKNLHKDEYSEFPYISLCGKEINFVTPEDPLAPVVFTTLDETEENLIYAGGQFTEPFNPENICWSTRTLRIYHSLLHHPRLKGEVGLLHPFLADSLANKIVWASGEQYIDGNNKFEWKNKLYAFKTLESRNAEVCV
jgi:hypothetical protein